MRWLLFVSLAVACVMFSGNAHGGMKLIKPDDPAGDEVRAVARDFLAAIAASDAATARRLLASSAEDNEPIDAAIQLSNSMQAFGKVAREQIKSEKLAALFASNIYAALSQGVSRRWMAINGDCAVLAPDGRGWPLDFDLVFARQDGKWKISAFSASARTAKAQVRFHRALAVCWDQLRTKVETGVVKNEDDYKKADRALMRGPLEAFYAESHQPASHAEKPTRLVSPPDDLTGLLRKDIFAPEVVRLVDGIDGVPQLSTFPTGGGLALRSPACGIELRFDLAKGLLGCRLHVRPDDEFNTYAGALPMDLKADDRRADVERKFGAPAESSGERYHSSIYRERGLQIDFTDGSSRDPDVRIKTISLEIPAPATTPRPQTTPRLAFRLAAADPADPRAEILKDPADITGKSTLPLLKEVLLDESAVARVYRTFDSKSASSPAIGVTMTPEGARRLREITAANIGNRLAFVLDGEVLMAPMVRSEIAEQVIITGMDTEIEATCRRLHAAVNALPTTRPRLPK